MTSKIVLFCDDVRFEVGNKVSLIGVYDERLLVPRGTPVLPQLTVFMRLETTEALSREMSIRATYMGKDMVADHEGIKAVALSTNNNGKYINITLSVSPITVTGQDDFIVYLLENGVEGDPIAVLPIRWDSDENDKGSAQ
ncbi:hypothetical protein [Micavibrio aeruginosavorus]|uniref:hypothetical protein n=1 Tax=Micavibrio aeruginosavorus TaxID=349221 RepID=UPI0005A26E08|nr:hypothetical protein [Micavibrio aeruginosavorus]